MRRTKRTLALAVCLLMSVSLMAFSGFTASAASPGYIIDNPYENVNWSTYGQYKAAHHTHSTYSDGSNFRGDMLIDKYNKGFDIVAMTDHDTTTTSWDALPTADSWNNNWNNIGTGHLTTAQMAAINNGTFDASGFQGTYTGRRQQSNGMISMGSSNEISANGGFLNPDGTTSYNGHHINAFWADALPGNIGTADGGRTMQRVLQAIQDAGGISHINHPGRYTGGQNNANASRDPVHVNKYAQLFMAFPSCVGIEIVNKWDGESIYDKVLWDNILMSTMPQGRPVWGFSNDDSHSLSGNGHAWNVMLMPALSQAGTRTSMETGAFYGVSRVDRLYGINHTLGGTTPGAPAQTTTTDTMYSGGVHNIFALGMLTQTVPSITNIEVTQGANASITVSGRDFNRVEWIADGVVIHTGATLNLKDYEDQINSYVRAVCVSASGIAFTQPFGVTEVSALSLTTNANLVKAGEYFRLYPAFDEAVSSNASTLTFTFDASKFQYRSFTPAAGVTLVDAAVNGGQLKLTVMAPDYNLRNYGEVLFSALDNATLVNEDNVIRLAAEYVVKADDDSKSIKNANTSVTFTTSPGAQGPYTLIDLSNLIDWFGVKVGDPEWAQARFFDFNGNGEIDIQDVATLAQLIV